MRVLPPDEAIHNWEQTLLGYSQQEAIAEARRSLSFDLETSTVGCPFHVDARRLLEHVARGEWNAAASVIHEAHPFPQVMGMHCHKYCETALVPSAGITRPRPEKVRIPQEIPNIGSIEWAVGRFGARPELTQGPDTGKRVAVVGGGSAGLMCAWVLRQIGHAVDVFDQDPLPGGLLFSGYPSFRLEKDVARRENDPENWGVTYHGTHRILTDDLQKLVADFDAVFLAVGRVPRRNFTGPGDWPIAGEDLDGILTGFDVLHEIWYGRPPTIGPRVMVFGGGQTACDVARAARRMDCEVDVIYRRGPNEMLVGPSPEVSIRMLEEEGIRVRPMQHPKRFIGRDGHVVAVELIGMEYGEADASGRPSTHPVEGTEEIVPVDTVLRAIGEIYDVDWLVEPLGIELMPGGYILVDPISLRTTNPKVWAGGDVVGGRGNHGAAYDGLWAARAIDAFLKDRFDEWHAWAESSDDADLLINDARGTSPR